MNWGDKIVTGFFQAVSTRTSGFTVINLSTLHPAVQVSYAFMMYISVYPITLSVRRTNVYEEKSLGVYKIPSDSEESDTDSDEDSNESSDENTEDNSSSTQNSHNTSTTASSVSGLSDNDNGS